MNYGKLKIYKLDGNIISYDVEIPESNQEFYTGLSYKDTIPENTGMLYGYLNSYPQDAKMYTPDTQMSVDFIFMDNVGTIIKIHKNAKPLSKEIISCYSVGAVLEVNAGDCEKYGIQLGDIAPIPLRSENKMFLPLNIKDLKYKKLGNTIYAINKENKYYMYSYKSHCWQKVDDDFEERYKEINQILRNFAEEENLDEETANDFAINYDKQLLFDYRKYQKRYYQNGKYLIYEYAPETGNFRYYKFKSGWEGWEHTQISASEFRELRETSQILTKENVDKLVTKIENDLTETEINEVNNENVEEYRNFRCGMFSYCQCFYKENDTQGWLHSFMDGSKEICENRLEKLKKNKTVYDYKIYGDNHAIWRFQKELLPSLPSAEITHQCSNWIIMPNENKIYLEDEIVKEPVNKVKETKNLTLSFMQTTWLSFDPSSFENENDINSDASFSIRTDYQKIGQYNVITDNIVIDIPKFIKDLDKNNFAVLHNEEYMYFKLLAWKHKDNKIRFIMQDYTDKDVKTQIDTIVEKKILLESFSKLEKSFKRLHEKNLKTYRQVYGNCPKISYTQPKPKKDWVELQDINGKTFWMIKGLYDNPEYLGEDDFKNKYKKLNKYFKKWKKCIQDLRDKNFKPDYAVSQADIDFFYDGMYFHLPSWQIKFKNSNGYEQALFDCIEKDIEKDLIEAGVTYIEYKVKKETISKKD